MQRNVQQVKHVVSAAALREDGEDHNPHRDACDVFLVVGREHQRERIRDSASQTGVDHHYLRVHADFAFGSFHVDEISESEDHHSANDDDYHEHSEHQLPRHIENGLFEEDVLSHLEENQRIRHGRRHFHRLLREFLTCFRQIAKSEVVHGDSARQRGCDSR